MVTLHRHGIEESEMEIRWTGGVLVVTAACTEIDCDRFAYVEIPEEQIAWLEYGSFNEHEEDPGG